MAQVVEDCSALPGEDRVQGHTGDDLGASGLRSPDSGPAGYGQGGIMQSTRKAQRRKHERNMQRILPYTPQKASGPEGLRLTTT